MLLIEFESQKHSKVGSGRQSTRHHFSPPVCFSTSLINQLPKSYIKHIFFIPIKKIKWITLIQG